MYTYKMFKMQQILKKSFPIIFILNYVATFFYAL